MSIFMKALKNAENNTIYNTPKTEGLLKGIIKYCESRYTDVHTYGLYNGCTEEVYRVEKGEYVHFVYDTDDVLETVYLITV